MLWDVFCRVVDNHGDLGVCWRLARDLAARGEAVRLWVDDARALAWMAPGVPVQVAPGATAPVDGEVQVLDWALAEAAPPPPGEAVVEAFGCDPPAAFLSALSGAAGVARADGRAAPAWINLEYLSAEDHAERSHRLPSPQWHGPAAGLVKHFFFPGFTPASGGLLREAGLAAWQDRFDAGAWRAAHGLALAPGERAVSLFCYAGAPVDALLDRLATRPTRLFASPGPAAEAVRRALGPALRRGDLAAVALPWLPQADYDGLLAACDLNLVRGEDSAVRAQWAGRPFVWQLYPQDDGADHAKREAFLRRFLSVTAPADGAADGCEAALQALWAAWNSRPAPADLPPLPPAAAWARRCRAWREQLLAQDDLVTRLLAFVASLRERCG